MFDSNHSFYGSELKITHGRHESTERLMQYLTTRQRDRSGLKLIATDKCNEPEYELLPIHMKVGRLSSGDHFEQQTKKKKKKSKNGKRKKHKAVEDDAIISGLQTVIDLCGLMDKYDLYNNKSELVAYNYDKQPSNTFLRTKSQINCSQNSKTPTKLSSFHTIIADLAQPDLHCSSKKTSVVNSPQSSCVSDRCESTQINDHRKDVRMPRTYHIRMSGGKTGDLPLGFTQPIVHTLNESNEKSGQKVTQSSVVSGAQTQNPVQKNVYVVNNQSKSSSSCKSSKSKKEKNKSTTPKSSKDSVKCRKGVGTKSRSSSYGDRKKKSSACCAKKKKSRASILETNCLPPIEIPPCDVSCSECKAMGRLMDTLSTENKACECNIKASIKTSKPAPLIEASDRRSSSGYHYDPHKMFIPRESCNEDVPLDIRRKLLDCRKSRQSIPLVQPVVGVCTDGLCGQNMSMGEKAERITYSHVRITEFSKYLTYEIMRGTHKRPTRMSSVIEEIFVTRKLEPEQVETPTDTNPLKIVDEEAVDTNSSKHPARKKECCSKSCMHLCGKRKKSSTTSTSFKSRNNKVNFSDEILAGKP